MKFTPLNIGGAWVVDPSPKIDERGFLARTYCAEEFASQGLNISWVQQNHTLTHGKGSLRGMHWQADPKSEIKLIRCLSGRVFDVIVDIRLGSKTFGQWLSIELSAQNMKALYVPAGVAHGFQCLEDSCELLYLMSQPYHPDLSRGLRHDDAEVGIKWPLEVHNLSARDQALPRLAELK